MKLLAFVCRPAQVYLFSFFLAIVPLGSRAQPPAKGGSLIVPAKTPGSYSDGRPTALYRLNAKDGGVVLRYGDGPDSCDYLGARDIWVYTSQGAPGSTG